ncbi:MAG TPA: amidase [Vicinamibacterales bacterium]|nr:amidase [Vicinamibacterales bacterium]
MRLRTAAAELRALIACGAVVAATATLAFTQAPASPRVALEEATVADLQSRMSSGLTTSHALVEEYLARIDALDRNGPALRALIELNPEALTIADRLDDERRNGRVRGPLHGIPIVIKDNIATGDRMRTSAGSLALADVSAPRDAFIVTRLRDAGAVLLGKTNLSEWANFRSTHSSSGWSARGGQTRNPYALDRSPSGSSSGTGVAVAANLATLGVGTETDGSIVSPSNVNGLVGIKPTIGLVSRTGIVPIAHSQDTAGPMARTVADAALLLTVLAAPDPSDVSTQSRARRAVDFNATLDAGGLRGARIGVVRNWLFGSSPAADALANAAIDAMKKQGATIVDPANVPTLGQFDDSEFEVLLYEFKADLPRFFEWWGPSAPLRQLSDLIAFNNRHPAEELRYFGQEIAMMAEGKGPLTDPGYRAALARNHRLAGADGIDAVMTRLRLDALVAPTGGPAWLIDLVNGDGGTASAPGPSTIAAVAGYPHVTVPMGFDRGLPVGLSFFGRAWSEATLIRLAYAYEQATRHRRPPAFAPTADLTP